jgi:hypothetical protein
MRRQNVRSSKKRFVPGSFQRGINFQDELEEHMENMKHYEEMLDRKRAKLMEAETMLMELEANGDVHNADEDAVEALVEDLNDDIERISTHMKRLKRDESVLRALTVVKPKREATDFELRLKQMNENFYDTYSSVLNQLNQLDQTTNEFDVFFDDKTSEHPSIVPEMLSLRNRNVLLLKVGEPGHMTCVLIHFDEPICEIWDTAQVNANVKRWFRSVLPEAYVIVCIDAQLQIGWCETGMKRNIYIVETKTKKPYINIYCQTWPYFFAYMRGVKRYSAANVIRFLSCLTDEQKILLIDEFNNNLANDGNDIKYIQEINDNKSFMSYVRACKPLGDLNRYVTFADANDTFEVLTDDEKAFHDAIKANMPRRLR